MAQVKYKHGTVRNTRHIVRNLIEAAGSMLYSIDHNEDEQMQEALRTLRNTSRALVGRTQFEKEQQVETLAKAHEALGEARKAALAASKTQTLTSHQSNMYDAAVATIDEARQHLTAGKQFAKDRRFVSKHEQAEGSEQVDEQTGEVTHTIVVNGI